MEIHQVGDRIIIKGDVAALNKALAEVENSPDSLSKAIASANVPAREGEQRGIGTIKKQKPLLGIRRQERRWTLKLSKLPQE